MKLSHTGARLAALILIAAGVFGAFGARAALADIPTVTLTVTPNSVAFQGSVTFTATVTSSAGDPTGFVSFIPAPLGAISPGQLLLSPVDASTRSATLTTSDLPIGVYSVTALYTPDFLASGIVGISPASSAVQSLTVGSSSVPSYTTAITLAGPSTITSTDSFDLVATVTRTGAGAGTGIPTGTVTFSDTSSGTPLPLITDPSHPDASTVPLVNGQATLHVTTGLAPGHYNIVASYQPDSADGSDTPSQTLAASSLDSNAPVDSAVSTTTDVTVDPTTIAEGDTVSITATVHQSAGALGPSSGEVSFTAESSDGSTAAVNTTSDLTLDPTTHSVTIIATGWQAGDYTIHASYVGNSFDHASTGSAPLAVLPPRLNTTVSYTGDTTVEFGHSATFAATLTDQEGDLFPDRPVTFTLGTQSCSGITDDSGTATCALLVTHDAGATNLSVTVPENLDAQGATLNVNFTVIPQATSTTVDFEPGPSTLTLTATLLTDTGAPLAGKLETLTLGAETCTATTDASGFASCTVATQTGPPAALTATFAGDSNYLPSHDLHTVMLSMTTSLTYTGAVTGDYHDPATLSASLEDGSGIPLSGQSVTFTLGSQTCTAATVADGSASCSITVSQPAADYPVTASFAGQGLDLASTDSTTFTVTPEQTTLSAVAIVGPSTTALNAMLNEDGVTPIAGGAVTLSLDSATCDAVTNASGIATCSVATPTGQTSAALSAAFAGDDSYLAASFSGTVTLSTPTALTYTGDTSQHTHDIATLSAKLVNATTGSAFGSQQVTFTLGSQSCHATTNSNGVATCWILLLQPSATYPLTVAFAGGSGYQASSTTSSFVVTKEETNVYVGVSGPVLNQSRLTLYGMLAEDGILPVANRTLTLKLGSLSCTGVTNTFGIATCTLPATAPLGPTTSSVTFAGDAWYLPATKSESALVYAHAPGGGNFVVGDRDDDGSVYFWGSQWSKHNSMSHGNGPSSFKGYANHGSPSCGRNWSTDPGNSSTPPSGALPAYMDVVVASYASKSGSSISGSNVHIVIVKTDAGYAGNPGHDGTGTVVATIV